MTRKKYTCFLLLLISYSTILYAQEKYSKVKIYVPATKEARSDLLGLLWIDHYMATPDGAVISEISAAAVQRLKKTNYPYQILVDDVAKSLREENAAYFKAVSEGWVPTDGDNSRVAFDQGCKTVNNIITTPSAFTVWSTFGGYYSYAQLVTAMDNLVATYPTLAQKISLGTSVSGNTIWAIKISDAVTTDDPNEPEVLYTGLQHAREAIGGGSLIFFMQYLCENYATNTMIRNLVDNREFFIVPCVNPDGYEYNRNNGGAGSGWRKNRKTIASGQFGVDLNRNYSIDWADCAGASASCGAGDLTSDNETYWGSAPFSEPETQAIRNLVITHHFVAAIDQHAYGPYYSLPFGRPSKHTMSAPDAKFYTFIPAAMGTYNGMRAGNSLQSVGYEVAGGIKDWLLLGEIGTGSKGKIYGMTGEGGAGGGVGGSYSNFWAPAAQIVNLCKGMCFQNLQLAYAAGSYVNIDDQNDMMLSTQTGTLNFKLTRVGLQDKPVKVSVIPLENVQDTGTSVTVNSLAAYYDTYTGSISYKLFDGITNGQRVRFAWKIETAGYVYYDTVTKFYNPVSLLFDDMEGTFATNWVANPTGTSAWGFTTAGTGYNSSGKALSESPAANTNYTGNSTRTVIYKGKFNLTDAKAAWLSFWTRHRAENFRDKLQVQVSTDSSAWVAICGSTTVQEPGTLDGSTINGKPALTGIRENWTHELFDLGAYNGATKLYLRFQFTSDVTGSGFDFELDDGFYIDNLRVIKSAATLVNLPVHFLNFTGKMLSNNTVQLDWEATVDEQHSYFEVERSNDAVTFEAIGRVASNPPYRLVDLHPHIGNNFYRIRQVDKDGRYMYSKTINVNRNVKVHLLVYPNPVTDVLKLKILENKAGNLHIVISDVEGRPVYDKIFATANAGEIVINTSSWAPQVYIVKVYNTRGEFIYAHKFARQ